MEGLEKSTVEKRQEANIKRDKPLKSPKKFDSKMNSIAANLERSMGRKGSAPSIRPADLNTPKPLDKSAFSALSAILGAPDNSDTESSEDEAPPVKSHKLDMSGDKFKNLGALFGGGGPGQNGSGEIKQSKPKAKKIETANHKFDNLNNLLGGRAAGARARSWPSGLYRAPAPCRLPVAANRRWNPRPMQDGL